MISNDAIVNCSSGLEIQPDITTDEELAEIIV
jgi:hypothetical protein